MFLLIQHQSEGGYQRGRKVVLAEFDTKKELLDNIRTRNYIGQLQIFEGQERQLNMEIV
jgi:hypothetical protein